MSRTRFSLSAPLTQVILLVMFAVVVVGLIMWITSVDTTQLPNKKSEALPLEANDVPPTAGESQPSERIQTFQVQGEIVNESGFSFVSSFVTVLTVDNGGEPPTIETDAYGRFSIRMLPGEYVVSASSPLALMSATRHLSLSDDVREKLIFQLPQARRIDGAVVDNDGQPIESAVIQLYAHRLRASLTTVACASESANLRYSINSGSAGEFAFESVWPGSYALFAQAVGYLPQRLSSVRSDSSAQIVLRKKASLVIRVLDDRSEPIFLSTVEARAVDSGWKYFATMETNQNGHCVFRELQRGLYRLFCSHPDYLPVDRTTADVQIEYSSETCELRLRHKGYSVRGFVLTGAERAPVSNYALSLYPRKHHPGQRPVDDVLTVKTGEFVFESIPPGLYRIEESHGSNIGKPYRIMTPVNGIPITVESQDVSGIEILAYPNASVSGHVYDMSNRPVEGAIVDLQMGDIKASTDANGYYIVPSMALPPPIDYFNIAAFAYHPDLGWGISRIFKYKPGDNLSDVDVTLGNEGVHITGHVTNSDSEPISSASVAVQFLSFPESRYKVNDSGEYSIEKAPFDGFGLKVSAEGYLSEHRNPRYPRHTPHAEENFILLKEDEAERHSIAGYVLDRNYQPLANARVEAFSANRNLQNQISDEQTQTDASGHFALSGLDPDQTYRILALSLAQPPVEAETNGVRPGVQDLMLIADFEPVEIILAIDDRAVADVLDEDAVLLVRIVNLEDQTYPPLLVAINSTEERNEKNIIINRPGRYLFSISRGEVNGKKIQPIDSLSPSQIPLTLTLRTNDTETMFYAAGRCVRPDSSPVTDPYRVICRLLDPADPASTQSILAPQDEDIYGFLLNASGLYEFIYLYMDGRVFNRQLVALSHHQAGPWKGSGLNGISLPDMVMPPVLPTTTD